MLFFYCFYLFSDNSIGYKRFDHKPHTIFLFFFLHFILYTSILMVNTKKETTKREKKRQIKLPTIRFLIQLFTCCRNAIWKTSPQTFRTNKLTLNKLSTTRFWYFSPFILILFLVLNMHNLSLSLLLCWYLIHLCPLMLKSDRKKKNDFL